MLNNVSQHAGPQTGQISIIRICVKCHVGIKVHFICNFYDLLHHFQETLYSIKGTEVVLLTADQINNSTHLICKGKWTIQDLIGCFCYFLSKGCLIAYMPLKPSLIKKDKVVCVFVETAMTFTSGSFHSQTQTLSRVQCLQPGHLSSHLTLETSLQGHCIIINIIP